MVREALVSEAEVGVQWQESKAEIQWKKSHGCSTIILCYSFAAELLSPLLHSIRMIWHLKEDDPYRTYSINLGER